MRLVYPVLGSFNRVHSAPTVARVVLFLLWLSVVVSPSTLFAQDVSSPVPEVEGQIQVQTSDERFASKLNISEGQWKRGFHGFNVICMGVKLRHDTLSRWRRTRADQTVLVMLGDLNAGSLRRNPIDLDFYLENGGSVLIASDSSNVEILRRQGVLFGSSGPVAQNLEDSFNGEFRDCPLVTNIQLPIPVLSGIDALVTNRPGVIQVFPNTAWKRLAYLPPMVGSEDANVFSLAGENRAGGKLICFADHSMFSNQMLMFGDNARAAKQSLEWLMGENRKRVLVLIDGIVQSAVDPADLNVELPQPTREEVVDALKDLPPSAMLEFGNAVLGVVEDENMINEFINAQMDRVRRPALNRFLIFVSFAMACLFAVVTYTWQKKLRRRTISDIANIKASQKRKSDKRLKKMEASTSKICFERQMAVLAMLDSFCLDFGNRRFEDLPKFPEGIEIGMDEHGVGIASAMKAIGSDYRNQPRTHWTEKRLLAVEGAVAHWRAYFDSGMSRTAKQTNVVEATLADS